MIKQELMVPTIHMNGTSKESLIEDICAATLALSKAHNAVCQTCPNGRDYYVQPKENFKLARIQHVSRLERLESVRLELEQIAEEIDRCQIRNI